MLTPAAHSVWALHCMVYRCDIYRREVDPNTDGAGLPGNRRWLLAVADVPYYHAPTRNFSEPSVIGRMLSPSQISVEYAYFLPDVDIQDQDMIIDTTPGGVLFGIAYRVLGSRTAFGPVPVPEASHINVELRQEPHGPEALPLLVAA